MQDELEDDHEGEEDVERKRNPIVRKCGPVQEGAVGDNSLVDVNDTHDFVNVSHEYRPRFVKNLDAYPMSRGTRGKGWRSSRSSWSR